MKLINRRILITGSLGFIGSSLKEVLVKEGALIDDFDINLGSDITNRSLMQKILKKEYFAIYHLAGFSGSNTSNSEIKKTFDVNLIATATMIEIMIKNNLKTKLILSGSRLEYGRPKYLPVDELHPTNPNSAYGISKLAATQFALAYAKSNNLKTTIFRTANVYGPHPNTKFKGYNIVNHFIDLAKKDEEIVIFGNGEQVRDYIYIDDLIKAFLLGLEPKADGQIYNLGYGAPIKFKEMAKIIIKTVNRGSLKHVSWPNDYKGVETGDYITDLKKINKDLNFKPEINFEEGIRRTCHRPS